MPEIDIRNLLINFPYEPYEIQREYMSKVVDCLQNVRKYLNFDLLYATSLIVIYARSLNFITETQRCPRISNRYR
jgi:hypothetical protein